MDQEIHRNVRCKFRCTEIGIIEGWTGEKQGTVYHAKFVPVGSGSPENDLFYAATPSGSLELQTIREMPFTVGKSYYLDIHKAD